MRTAPVYYDYQAILDYKSGSSRLSVRGFGSDDRLEIVPGSHARWDTPDELRIRRGADRTTPDMPNAARVGVLRESPEICLPALQPFADHAVDLHGEVQ